MIVDRAVRRIGPAYTSWPRAARIVLVGAAVAWVALTGWAIRGGGAHGGPAGVVDPWRPAWLLTWLLMVAAMMWPLAVPAVAVVNRSAFRAWRARLVAAYLGTVTVLWVVAGLAVAAVAQLLAVPAGAAAWQLGGFVAAVLAGRSARRARLLQQCSRTPPVAPGGVRGLVSASLAGVVTWRRCALLCGPVMAAMVVGHDPVLMLLASLAAWWEAAHPRAWRDPVPALLLSSAAAWVALLLVAGAG